MDNIAIKSVLEQAHEVYETETGFDAPVTTVNGRDFVTDADGSLIPVHLVKPQHMLEDQTVRKIIGFARELSAQVARFRQHCFDDVDALTALLADQYKVSKGGKAGNLTLMSYDGLFKVTVQVAKSIAFGPELQTAKALADECVLEWSADARPELMALVQRAFNTDSEGRFNRGELVRLLRFEIADDRWQRAMQALRDSMRTDSTKRYVRCHFRTAIDAPWNHIVIDVAAS